jgi:hypothetical protein
MIRPLTIATFLMASGSGLYLYQSKHEAQVLDRTIEKTLHETATYREQSRLLAAEWTMLNDPESLRRFSDTYLALKTITPSQFTSLADLDGRLPPVPPPPTSGDSDEETGEPVAAAPDAAPLPAAAEAQPVVVADHPVQVPSPPAVSPPVAAATTRAPERKVAVSRLPAPDAAYKPSATDPVPAPRVVAASEPRPSGQHSSEPHVTDRRIPQYAETHATEAKVAETHVSAPPPQPRPMIVAAASHPAGPAVASAATANPPAAPMALQAPMPAARGGSLLGMARNSVSSPLPRPTPVNATQSYNAN